MKKGYLIAVDLDGTLIQNLNDYDIKSFDYLRKLAKDNYVIIATGRPLRASKFYYDLLELKTPIINYNGALIHNPSDNNFPKTMVTISKNSICEFFEDNQDIINNIFCEIEDDIYLYKEENYIEKYLNSKGGLIHLGKLSEILTDDPNGAIVFSPHGCEKRLEEYINSKFKGEIKIRFWDDVNYLISEIYNPLTIKANGIKQIIDYYHIPFEKTIAIGDGHNDIDMLNEVKYGVAMGNSHKLLLQEAKLITKSVSEHGVYEYLFNFFEK